MKYKTLLQEQYLDRALELRRQGYCFEEISNFFSIGHDTVRKWCVTFAPELLGHNPMKTKRRKSASFPESNFKSDSSALEERIKELESELKREKLRADFYDEMINVAEAKFNIPIRKKAGTKR